MGWGVEIDRQRAVARAAHLTCGNCGTWDKTIGQAGDRARRLRTISGASTAIAILLWAVTMLAGIMPKPAAAQNATWLQTPVTNGFFDAVNWSTGSVPTGTATFGVSNTTNLNLFVSGWSNNSIYDAGQQATLNGVRYVALTGNFNVTPGSDPTVWATVPFAWSNNTAYNVGQQVTLNGINYAALTGNFNVTPGSDPTVWTAFTGDRVGGITLTPGASNYNFSLGANTLTFTGAGIVVNGGSVNLVNDTGVLNFDGSSTASSATITTNGGAQTLFASSASGGTARFILNGTGILDISQLTNGGTTAGSIEGSGTIFLGANNLTVGGNNLSTTFSGALQDRGRFGNGTGGSLTKVGTGTLTLSGVNTYTGGTTVTGGLINFSTANNFGTGAITLNGGGLQWATGSTTDISGRLAAFGAGGASFDTNGNNVTLASTLAGIGGLTKLGQGTLTLFGVNIYTGGTTVTGGLINFSTVNNFGAGAITLNGGGLQWATGNTTDISGRLAAFGSGGATFDTNGNNVALASALSGTGGLTKIGLGTLTLSAANTYTGGTLVTVAPGSPIVAGGLLQITGAGTLGAASGATAVVNSTLDLGGTTQIQNGGVLLAGATIQNGTLSSSSGFAMMSGTATVVLAGSGGLNKTTSGTVFLTEANTYTGGTTVSDGTLRVLSGATLGAASGTTTVSGGTLDLGGTTQTQAALNLAGGTVQNGNVNASITSTGGTLNGLGGTASLTTTAGTTTLLGTNSYTGATNVNGGVLDVEGIITATSAVMVNAGGVLTGTGIVDPLTTTIASGAALVPGNGTPGTSLTIDGNLAFQTGAIYLVQVNPSAASFATVTGTATLGGAAVNAVFANGSYISKTYTILTAAGGVSGSFASNVVSTNLPANFSTGLSYDATHAYLDLSLNYAPGGAAPNFGSGLSGNQQAVANALVNSFNANGGIPLVYGALNPAGLTQASGELGTSSQQTTFNAMGQFMGVLTDPFMQRSGGPGSSGAPGFAEEEAASAYAARKRTDAFAMFAKAPPVPFVQRWSVWATGFGGSQSTDSNAVTGSNNTTSNIYGAAVGADYLLSPNTLAGFALAGGGTSFSVNGLGSGRSDLFQAGAYVRHNAGPAYVSAALAYGWQDITTDRTVIAAGIDHLRAEFNANAWSGRLEGGYRFVVPWSDGIGITPYAAAQFTTFDLPAYAEQVIS